MMMSASPGRGGGDATYGVDRSTMANSAALTAALTIFAAPTRAHDAARPARSAWSVQRQLAARFDGEVAGGADSFFVISGSGQRWSSGGRGDR
jgi:hypothetical protein